CESSVRLCNSARSNPLFVRHCPGTSHAFRKTDLISVRVASMEDHLVSKLPLPESFEAQYLEYNGILPLEITGDQLRVAVVGEPAVEVLDDLEVSFGLKLELVPVTAGELQSGIRRAFARLGQRLAELRGDLE